MLRSAATTIAVITLIAGTAFAQGNGRNSARNQGIPPGQMPPAGQCRVWYEGRAPGQQPRATNCNEAERIASRSNTARVIYGSDVRNSRVGATTVTIATARMIAMDAPIDMATAATRAWASTGVPGRHHEGAGRHPRRRSLRPRAP